MHIRIYNYTSTSTLYSQQSISDYDREVPVFIITTLSGSLYNARTGARKPSLLGPVFISFSQVTDIPTPLVISGGGR